MTNDDRQTSPSVQQRVRDRWFNDDLKSFAPTQDAPAPHEKDEALQRYLVDAWTR